MMIFGGGGDLAWRKLVPSLHTLFVDGQMSQDFAVIGVDIKEMDEDGYRDHLRTGVEQFSRRANTMNESWTPFASHLHYVHADFTNDAAYEDLKKRLQDLDTSWRKRATRIFYMAVPPRLIPPITDRIGKAGLAEDRRRARIIVEKPFGRDLETAQILDCILLAVFAEEQIYRIDHFLGKETVQNILAFRFGNALFEPLWDRKYIDNVQITVAESMGIGHRGAYYDNAGALRDMVQNHLLQSMCLVAMDPPGSFTADEIRNKKVDVLHSIRPIAKDQVREFAVRGQYGAGKIDGQSVAAYRSEPRVDPNSGTETYVAVKLYVDNWRWQDVPFYLRTGKRMAADVSEVSIQFHPVPHQPFPASAIADWSPNRLGIRIQPKEGIVLSLQAKRPGQPMCLVPVHMLFDYHETFKSQPPEPYEILLVDVMQGDQTLFMRADQIEAAWSVIKGILDAWETLPVPSFPNYEPGTWGPGAAETLLTKDGRRWLPPSISEKVTWEQEHVGKKENAPDFAVQGV